MSNLGSTSSDLLLGKKFLKKFLYVQHIDDEKDTVSETSDRYLEEYLLADRTNFTDSKFTEYLKSPNENLSILKSSMRDKITEVTVYSNPLPLLLQQCDVTIHAFVVFQTWNDWNGNLRKTWWSIEKNGTYMVLQHSPNKDDVINKLYDTEQKTSVERIGPVEEKETEIKWIDSVEDLLRTIWDNNQISERYNVWNSNCQHFASFIFEISTGEKWSTTIVNRIGFKNQKIQYRIQVDKVKYKSIINDKKFDFYRAMMEERSKDFKKLNNNLTIECLNDVDSQGNTLLEWATVFSSSDWPIDEELKKKGAVPAADEKLFRRNVFFIALQYLPPNKKLLSFDGIDIRGVNKTGDTSLHLALYGEKWEIAEDILRRFKDSQVNSTNSLGDTPLLLAARLKCEFGLFKKILNRTNKENVNKTDENGWTALHYAIDKKSQIKVEELLAHKDVDVNIKNNDNCSALQLASEWEDIPSDLFKLISDRLTNETAREKEVSSFPCQLS